MSINLDESTKGDLVKKLEEVGLSDKEARVYIALLPYRDIGSSKLIRATGLHGQFVYDALEKLEEFGLAKHVIQNGRKKFTANPPSRILSMIEQKKLSAQSVIHQLSQRFAGAGEQEFEVYQGDNAYLAHQLDLLKNSPDGSSLDVVSGEQGKSFRNRYKEVGLWDEYERVRKEKKIGVRFLGTEPMRETLEWRKQNEFRFEYRIIPNLSTGAMGFDIRPGSVTISVFGDPLLDFTVYSKPMADGYLEFFNALWNLSSK